MLIRHFDPAIGHSHDWRGAGGIGFVANHVWDAGSMAWVPATASGAPGSVSVTNFPATYPVTGTFWQATQPVSIAASVAVTGTFWQATQPVSGPLTDAQLRALAVPVSGTFWQATQPVSGTVVSNAGTNLNTSALALEAGGNLAAIATALQIMDDWDETDRAKVNLIAGQVGVAGGTGVRAANVTRVTVATDDLVPVSPPALTKGTQGSTGFSVQQLKDAGRVNLQFYATAIASGATGVETAITLQRRPDTGAGSGAVSFVVTSGKRFRITSLTFAARGHATATIQVTTFSIRVNTAGAVITSTTPIILQVRVATPATASAWDRFSISPADSPELLGDGTMQFGITANAVFVTNAPTWDVLITGYEY